jgi:hypothetical protein
MGVIYSIAIKRRFFLEIWAAYFLSTTQHFRSAFRASFAPLRSKSCRCAFALPQYFAAFSCSERIDGPRLGVQFASTVLVRCVRPRISPVKMVGFRRGNQNQIRCELVIGGLLALLPALCVRRKVPKEAKKARQIMRFMQ